MRVFITACVVSLVLALVGAAVLNQLVQRPSDSAFSTPSVRI